ncbi:MAG: cytochrome c maturation protein CcmE [Polyangiales bacterium]
MTNEQDSASPMEAAPRRGIPGVVKVGIVFVILVGAAGWLLSGSDNPFVYSKLVHEVMSSPGSFEGRRLRVEGELRQGSIQFREDPCEWRFVLQQEGKEMPVRFPQCVVPDTFRDGMGIQVTVQGELGGDGVFLANQVIPRCPSKYEMQQRMEAGEEMPYDPNAPLPGQS